MAISEAPAPTGKTKMTLGNKLAHVVIGVVVAVAAIGWAIIYAYSEGQPGITPQIMSYSIKAHSVDVQYELSKPKGKLVHCAVVAYDVNHAVIGRVPVTFPRGHGDFQRDQVVPTTSKATAADLVNCL
jgi:Domain of unknown function (DUF4307)